MSLSYRLDRTIRSSAMGVTGICLPPRADEAVTWERERIDRILLVRGIFRMGNAVLNAPAIELLAMNFPQAQIDFVGPPITNQLFQNLPLGNFYEISRSFPKVIWSYFKLMKELRARRYDLAIDVSGSSAAMGSFIVGFSGARWRAGRAANGTAGLTGAPMAPRRTINTLVCLWSWLNLALKPSPVSRSWH